MRLARVRATAYPKLTLSLRVLGRRADGFHELEALVVSLGQPHDVLEAYAVPAPGRRAASRSVGDDAGDDVPTDHTNLAFIAAEKLMVRAGRSGHGVRLVLRKRIPAGARARRRLGRRGRRAARGARASLDVDIDDAGVLEIAAEVGSDVPFCLRGGAAWMRGRGEVIEPVVARRRARVPRRDPAVPAVDPDGVPRPGTSSAARAPTRVGARAAPRRQVLPELANDLEPAAEAVEPRLVEFRAALEAATGRARAARRQRLGVRGAGRRRACAARRSSTRSAAACACRSSARRACRAASASAERPADDLASQRGYAALRRQYGGRLLAALLATLPARLLQQLLVLLLPHALAALLDQ